ncbi:MAG TPA: hypothetical protein VFP22_02185 [Candidatus Limnocylindrales bacterium]|nr:hypothetical protein [Candidatus Limnocylindrales bacterium]
MTLPAEFVDTARGAHESMEKIAGFLDAYGSEPAAPAAAAASPATVQAAAAPAVTAGVTDQAVTIPNRLQANYLRAEQRIAVARELRKRTDSELMLMFAEQAIKGHGIPLDLWLSKSEGRSAAFGEVQQQVSPDIARAIDTSSASALIRQDLEPVLYEIFVREFPGFERFRREPANGLTHTWQQKTTYGDAQFMGELGTVTDDRAAYLRQTTNVAIIATRRGVSLKSLFAVQAGGAGFNLEQEELTAGLQAIAHRVQYQIFSGHSTDNTGTANNEKGLYDPNAFTGLRSILNTARAKNVDPLASTPEDIRRAINQAATEVMQQGGKVSMLWGSPLDKEVFDAQQDKNVRYMQDLVNVAVGVTTNAVNTVFGALPYGVLVGDAIGAYVPDVVPSGWTTARDLYLLDERGITMPYLGAEGPTILDIPIGISGQLTHLFIIFGMWGLAVKTPTFQNKVRIRAS